VIWDSQSQSGTSEYFFHDLIRKYVVVFGRTFSDIIVQRTNANNITADIKVPLEYIPKEKAVARLVSDPNLDRPFSVLLPIMTFEIVPPGMVYDSERKIGTLTKKTIRNPTDKNHLQIMYSPVPYNIYFDLHVYVKDPIDGCKILEQILPIFQPDWTPQIQLIPEMNTVYNVAIEKLPNLEYQDLYDDKLQTRRLILYTLHFRVRAWFFGPERNKPIIKFTTLNIRAGSFTNNAVTIYYSGANGNIPIGSNVYSWANAAIHGAGTVNKSSYQKANTGMLQVNVVSGSFTNDIFTYGNTVTAHVSRIVNGIYDDKGNVLDTPGIAEVVYSQPGLTSAGLPTTSVPSSVNWTLVDIDDDYGFASQVQGGEIP